MQNVSLILIIHTIKLLRNMYQNSLLLQAILNNGQLFKMDKIWILPPKFKSTITVKCLADPISFKNPQQLHLLRAI